MVARLAAASFARFLAPVWRPFAGRPSARCRGAGPMAACAAAFLLCHAAPAGAQAADYAIEGDGIPKPLAAAPGNAARGKALIAQRGAANCLDCHRIDDKDLPAGGSDGPPLDGVGAALTAAQLRLSVAELGRVSAGTRMPGFHKRGAAAPRLDAQQIEDLVAYLATLRR